MKEAYSSTTLPPLGRSDHNLIHLVQVYKSVISKQPATTTTVKVWSIEAEKALQDCFQTTCSWRTMWRTLRDSPIASDYIKFCEDRVEPTKKFSCFPNNKPCIKKKRAFMAADREGTRSVQKELRRELRAAKNSYSERLEGKPEINSGVCINNKLDWTDNTESLYRKSQSRLFFLRRLRSFDACGRLLKMFHQSVVASTLSFAGACWGGGIKAGESNRLNKLVRKASSVVGLELDSLEVVKRRMRVKFKSIVGNPSHPLYAELWQMGSTFSHRLITPRYKTSSRFRCSFVPAAIRLCDICVCVCVCVCVYICISGGCGSLKEGKLIFGLHHINCQYNYM